METVEVGAVLGEETEMIDAEDAAEVKVPETAVNEMDGEGTETVVEPAQIEGCRVRGGKMILLKSDGAIPGVMLNKRIGIVYFSLILSQD